MTTVNAATLAGNVLAMVNEGLGLIEPEPQYFFAGMAMGNAMRSIAIQDGMTTEQYLARLVGNGAPVSPVLTSLVRAADAYPGIIIVKNELGKRAGDTIKIRRPVYGGGGYTEDARRVVPDKTTATDSQAIRSEDSIITLHQFEGPYSTTNSRVEPYGILDFDARARANANDVVSEVKHHLGRDYIVWKNSVLGARTAASQYITYSDAVANVAAMTAGAGHYINLRMILRMKQALQDRNWPTFPNGKYMLLVPSVFDTQIVDDFEYRQMSSNHTTDRNIIFSPVASIQNVDIFTVTTLRTFAAGDTVAGSTVPSGVRVHEALMIGPGILGHGQGMLPQAYYADDTNYGKVRKVIWRSEEGFQTFDERGIQRGLFQEDV